jgi:uncharacterized repeat protein (TIGR01451 family)/uncharacterized repeat protein (TIGR02543 family)
MKIKICAIALIQMLIIASLVGMTAIAEENEPEWPTSWILFDTDSTENGPGDDYRDVQDAYYNVDNNYLYFRLECYGYPNFTAEPNSRYKWFIDIDDPHNMGQSGGKVYEAEYLLFIEDTNDDSLGDIYLLPDVNNSGLPGSSWPDYKSNPGPITDTSVAGYRIEGDCIDLYINLDNISNPEQSYFTWATDQEDPNLDSAPNIDRSDAYWEESLLKADLSIVKSDSVDPVDAGETLTYTLNVTNHGPHNHTTTVNVTDMLPAEVTFVSSSSDADDSGFDGSVYWWTYPFISIGESKIITINVIVDSGASGHIINIVNVYSDIYDPIPGNNEYSEETTIATSFNLIINIDGNGNVVKDPDQSTYLEGTLVELTAVADPGWTFSHWSGDLTGSANPENIVMDSNKTVTAHFIQDQYTLTVLIDGNGAVTKNPDQSTYVYGDTVELTANADPGWTFSHWTGDLTGSNNPENILIDGDKTVTAHFTQDQYTLTININGNGNAVKDPDQATYTYGTTVELTANADPGWTFSHWTGDLTGSNNPENILIDGDKTVTAHFTQDQYTLTININGNGTVTVEPIQDNYTYGNIVNLTAVADPGWTFSHWTGDLSSNNSNETIFIDESKNVTAHFTQDKYTLNITIVGSGNVSKDPDQSNYTYGTNVNLTAIPFAGYAFDHWSGDLNVTSRTGTINMSSDKYVTVHFTRSGGGGGGGNGGGDEPPVDKNKEPTADIEGPYYGNPDEEIQFDGSKSHDNDEDGGTIERYDWKFFEEDEWHNDIGATPTYIYSKSGIYNISLRVFDDEGSNDIDTSSVVIAKPNIPPSIPEITGPNNGTQNITYNFSVVSTDGDGDEIKYTIDWGDNTTNESGFIPSGTPFEASHKWAEPGNYTIKVTADDGEAVSSNEVVIEIVKPDEPKPKEEGINLLPLLLLIGLLLLLLLILLEKRRREKKDEQKPQNK